MSRYLPFLLPFIASAVAPGSLFSDGPQQQPVEKPILIGARAVTLRITGTVPTPGKVVDLIIEVNDEAKSLIIFPEVLVISGTHTPANCASFAFSVTHVQVLLPLFDKGTKYRARPPSGKTDKEKGP